MSNAHPPVRPSSAPSAASPAFAALPFLAELQSVNTQETLVLKLQSDKVDCLRTLKSDMDRLARDINGSADAMETMYARRLADYEGTIRQESAQLDKMTKLVADSRRLRVDLLRKQREQCQRAEQTQILEEREQRQRAEQAEIIKERDELRDQARRAVWIRKGAVTEVEALRRELSEEKKLHEETRLLRDRQISGQNDKEKEDRKGVEAEVEALRRQLSEEKRLHGEVRLARDREISERNDKENELVKVSLEVEFLREHLKKMHEEARLAEDQFSKRNNELGELCDVLKKEKKALLEVISEEREVREEMKSKIEKLRAELLEEREHVREEIMLEMKLEEVEREISRRALLEQQAKENRRSEQTTARD